MKYLFDKLGNTLKDISDQMYNAMFTTEVSIPDTYEVQINDHYTRVAKTVKFDSVRSAMEWVQSQDLLHNPDKSVYLVRVKSSGVNDILQLTVYKPHVSTQRPTVYRSQTENQAVFV
jgi:hypothetical protein